MNQIKELYYALYGNDWPESALLLETFLGDIQTIKGTHFSHNQSPSIDWYKDAVVYSTYGDLFNKDLNGLKDKLDYLVDLGVNCIWLLPILESPMKDAGFDISNYNAIRPSLLGLPEDASETDKNAVFDAFVKEAHGRGIRIIFDIAMNHCSVEHEWFQNAISSKDSDFRDYFIWSDDTSLYQEARIIFKGMCSSNWEYEPKSGQYYFHRFFDIQPDLNYRNPKVLLSMAHVLVDWKVKGVDGIRADAVPYIWKEKGTICENLPKTHTVVKFFRAVLDYLEPGSLLLAEACQPPQDVVAYFGDGDECNGAYHFPVMPRIYKALAEGKKNAIEKVMAPNFTPSIPENCQWFMFLRCHDELTLEMVTPEEREMIYKAYVTNPLWDFRQGEGISSRLAELFHFDLKRILLANSIMLTLLGTPIIYYGDEIGKANDEAYFNQCYRETGYKDSRYLARGPLDFTVIETILSDPHTLGYALYYGLKHMIHVRSQHPAFARGTLEFLDVKGETGDTNDSILAYRRQYKSDSLVVLHNLTGNQQTLLNPMQSMQDGTTDLLSKPISAKNEFLQLEPYAFHWFTV